MLVPQPDGSGVLPFDLTEYDDEDEENADGGKENLVLPMVACASNHSLALSDTGVMYSWGNGGSGGLPPVPTDAGAEETGEEEMDRPARARR